MSNRSKVLQVNYRSHSNSSVLYAEAAETLAETIRLINCRAPRTIRCGVTGRDEIYAEFLAELLIPRGSAREIVEVDRPEWWDTTREVVLTDLVWLNMRPWSSNKQVSISQLQGRISKRRQNWDLAMTRWRY